MIETRKKYVITDLFEFKTFILESLDNKIYEIFDIIIQIKIFILAEKL